ncbi:MAG: hypothetical protein LBP76_15110 [Treponema sp.]|nr:hypothetical protein [Treponema sp.]
MRRILPGLFYTTAVLYPVLMFYFLVIRKIPVRLFSLIVIAIAAVWFISLTAKKKRSVSSLPVPCCWAG